MTVMVVVVAAAAAAAVAMAVFRVCSAKVDTANDADGREGGRDEKRE